MKNKRHHILSRRTAVMILAALTIGTVMTVAASRFNLGAFNFPIAILIATIKASLVALFFMGLKFDSNENRAIFGISAVFLAIFFALTATDYFYRGPHGEVYIDVNRVGEVFTPTNVRAAVDPAKPLGGLSGSSKPTLPIDLAIEILSGNH